MLIKALLTSVASQMDAEEVKAMMRDGTTVFYHGIPPQGTEGHTLSHDCLATCYHNQIWALTSFRCHLGIFEASRQEPGDIRDGGFDSLDSGKIGEQERVICF